MVRVYRIGQQKPVYVARSRIANSMEDRMVFQQGEKLEMSADMLGDSAHTNYTSRKKQLGLYIYKYSLQVLCI
jgi:SNF2 family DNA or RNA helicase